MPIASKTQSVKNNLFFLLLALYLLSRFVSYTSLICLLRDKVYCALSILTIKVFLSYLFVFPFVSAFAISYLLFVKRYNIPWLRLALLYTTTWLFTSTTLISTFLYFRLHIFSQRAVYASLVSLSLFWETTLYILNKFIK
jgi:hypothetical protein